MEDSPSYPSLSSEQTGNTTAEKAQAAALNAKDSIVNSEASKLKFITNSHIIHRGRYAKQRDGTGSEKRLGPVATNLREQTDKTQQEFQNLANARTPPAQPAATGQPLTHYHSLFYSLLSWENPRASAVSYVCIVLFILASRYLNVLGYLLKISYFVLGVTATLEVTGKLVFDAGLASKLRPKKYYTIPREALEASLEDVEQLINFFVIETQRIVFAENVIVTVAVFFAALVSYGLIKLLPLWGLLLTVVSAIYMGPLIYVTNREAFDGLINEATDMVNAQASQIRDMTAQHANTATRSIKSNLGEYSSRAQQYMHTSLPSKSGITNGSTTLRTNGSTNGSIASSMPSVPTADPTTSVNTAYSSGVQQPLAA